MLPLITKDPFAACSDAENLALSVSVQLSPPAAYLGGRLQFEGEQGPVNATSVQGAAIFFSPARLHRVEPIVAGTTRFALVAWFRVRDDLFWGRDALLSSDPCITVFPLLSPRIPATFSKLPLPTQPEILVSAARRTGVSERAPSTTEGATTSPEQVDPSVEFLEIELPSQLGPPRQLCVVSPWPSSVAVCSSTDGQVDQQHRLAASRGGVLELLAFDHRYQLRPCS